MQTLQSRSAALVLLVLTASLAGLPPTAAAFEAIDTMPWPSEGTFPAYPAESDRPLDLWLHAGALRDSNALRLESGEQADTIMRLGGGLRYDGRVVGRQRVRLEARGDYYKYDHFSNLDHFAYALLGNWLWEVGNQLSGSVRIGHDRRQIDISETRTDRLELATSTEASATAGYLVMPSLRIRGGVGATRSERDQGVAFGVRTASYTAGADYVSPLGNTIGLEYRSTDGEQIASDVTGINSDYRERELSLVATYVLGTRLRSAWRVGHTTRDYDDFSGRNFSGGTYTVTIDWLPGNKTILGFEAYRVPRSIIDVAASHILVQGVAFGPRWAVTNKLVLSARLVRENRAFSGDPALAAGGTLRDEDVHLWRFALGWEPLRFWQVGLALDLGERESNIAGRDYQYSAVMANLAYNW